MIHSRLKNSTRHTIPIAILSASLLLTVSCGKKLAPYANGPVMSQKDIRETFQPILSFMEAKPGMTFADVGASSGAITVMMATLLDNTNVYIQDIDTTTLQQKNLDKILDFHSKQSRQDLRSKNNFHLVIGDTQHSKLPDSVFDLIYTNATIHVFDAPDSMLADLRNKLKPNGRLFVRDSFKNDHGEGSVCSDKTCAKPLYTIDDFLVLTKRNGLTLVKRSDNMSGYPVFGFERLD